jgi:hypothetical protein
VHREVRNAHQEIDRRPQPVAGEFQILLRIPNHRVLALFSLDFLGPICLALDDGLRCTRLAFTAQIPL